MSTSPVFVHKNLFKYLMLSNVEHPKVNEVLWKVKTEPQIFTHYKMSYFTHAACRLQANTGRIILTFTCSICLGLIDWHGRHRYRIQRLKEIKRKWSPSDVFDSLRFHGLAYQGLLYMGFSRQEYWIGLPFPSSGDLPDPRIELHFRYPAFQADALPSEPLVGM